jgi:hypothetical protein
LLLKATSAFGDQLIADLRSVEICAWRVTLPEGHRFEATQALRQVLNATVAWDLIDANPARQGVPLLERDQLGRPEPSGDRNTTIGPVTASSCEARALICSHGQVDVAAEPATALDESGCSISSSLTFGVADVSWTPPLRNVFFSDNETTC